MPHLSCHTLRHTFGHDLAVKHVSLDVIARLMGHCKKDGSPNIAMTMRYTSPGLSDLENAVELIAWN
jgi:integrase